MAQTSAASPAGTTIGAAPGTTTGTTTPGTTPGTTPAGTTSGAAAAPSACNVNTFTPVTAPLQQLKFSLTGGANVTIGGSVAVTNGCTFTVSNFAYFYAASESFWFGSNSTDPTASQTKVCDTPVVQSTSQTESFTLSSAMTFDYFDVLNLYSYAEKAVFAQAILKTPPKNSTPTQSGTSSNGGFIRSPMSSNMIIIICALIDFFFYLNSVN